MWPRAIGEVLMQDLQVLWTVIQWPLLAASVGATIGSIRRWYWARWQLGVVAGLCMGAQVSFLTVNYSARSLLISLPISGVGRLQDGDLQLLSAILAATVAISVSILSDIALQYLPEIYVGRFRAHPFQWFRSSGAWKLANLFALSLPFFWIVANLGQIMFAKEELQVQSLLQDLQSELPPRGIQIGYTIHYEEREFWVKISSVQALLDSPVFPPTSLPNPSQLQIEGDEIGDIHIAQAIPKIKEIPGISFSKCAQITDRSFDVLTACSGLKFVGFYDCPSISDSGIQEFHRRRPDVGLRVQTGYDWYVLPASP